MSIIQPIILAAGKGTRLKSERPKALALLNGRPLISYLLQTFNHTAYLPPIVVLGYKKEEVAAVLLPGMIAVDQGEPLGTGHAVQEALVAVPAQATDLLVCFVDMPLWRADTFQQLESKQQATDAVVTLAYVDDTSEATAGFGRLLFDEQDQLRRAVEVKNATAAEQSSPHRNAGLYLLNRQFAEQALPTITPDSLTGEIYLPVVVDRALAAYKPVVAVEVPLFEALGINTPAELAAVEQALKAKSEA